MAGDILLPGERRSIDKKGIIGYMDIIRFAHNWKNEKREVV